MKIKNTVWLVIMIFGTFISKGQQDPMYTQYIFNLQTINPAYAGSWQTIGFLGMTRLQWVGMRGHPTTQTFSFQTPLKWSNVGVGFNVIHDEVGFEKKLTLNLDYSYCLNLSSVTSLRLGLKGGFTSYSNNLAEYQQYPDHIPDPLFQTSINNQFMPNLGVGIYLSSLKYYLSLSAPRLFENNYKSNINNYTTTALANHFFITGGLLFDLSDRIKFKPTFLTQMISGAPVAYDLSANFLLAEKLWLGGMIRSGDALGGIVQWLINKKFRIGYAYDFTTTHMRSFQNGVHEVMLSYEFVYTKREFTSPRYF